MTADERNKHFLESRVVPGTAGQGEVWDVKMVMWMWNAPVFFGPESIFMVASVVFLLQSDCFPSLIPSFLSSLPFTFFGPFPSVFLFHWMWKFFLIFSFCPHFFCLFLLFYASYNLFIAFQISYFHLLFQFALHTSVLSALQGISLNIFSIICHISFL